MKKEPVSVNIHDLTEILEKYLDAKGEINYAIKILGHPGIGKSSIVRQVSRRKNRFFIDTRLAFKENVDLSGYPVPDHEARRMIYYRPNFIPPETVPQGFDGIVWFLDEANRAHPTVIQTLFQIITERTCGEHPLPQNTAVMLAGNLGEEDFTTITDFDDTALDGRLAVFHLKPRVDDWLIWARENQVHPCVIRYISLFPEKLWDEAQTIPNPRGWHQVSQSLRLSYGLDTEADLYRYLRFAEAGTLEKVLASLVGQVAAGDFLTQLTSPRELTTAEVLRGSEKKLAALKTGRIPAEDMLWAVSGALETLKDMNAKAGGRPGENELAVLASVLRFIGHCRADARMSFFFLLIKECGLFTAIPAALDRIAEPAERETLLRRFSACMDAGGESDDSDLLPDMHGRISSGLGEHRHNPV